MSTPQDPPIPLIRDLNEKRGYRFYEPGSDGSFGTPAATQQCQVLYSINGTTFVPALPVTSVQGWLVNSEGCLIVNG